MGKKDEKKEDKLAKKAKREESRAPRLPSSALLVGLRLASLLVVFGGCYTLSAGGAFYSAAEGKMHIVPRLTFFLLAQSLSCEFFAVVMLQVGRRLVGDRDAAGWEPTKLETAVNDPGIVWPRPELLSEQLRPFLGKRGQPFWLNHVGGRRRCKDACMRAGMAFGSVLTVWFCCRFLDMRPMSSLGLVFDGAFAAEILTGTCVGVSLVAFIFAVELLAGWLHFLQLFEVFDKSEGFAANIFWDAVFHAMVSVNEELPVRGWMLFNLADACAAHMGLAPTAAFLLALVVESAFFVVMHLNSPGGDRWQSITNIFVGGVAGGLNVLFTGGRLGFSLGWHFGWNISMGNVFGLSTSGIPISATFVAVAPHPEREAQHGGVFGPEGGVVAPAAYCLGILALGLLYGMPGDGALGPSSAGG